MDNILKLLNFIYVIILLVFCLVKEIEIPGWGQNKKKAILNIVAEFYNKLAKNNVLLITKENLLGFTGNFIDIIVGFFNIVGWIKYDSPYRQFLGNSWLEKKTIPYWEKLFKILKIYNVDYHKKYRKMLHQKRYNAYINMVIEDIQNNIVAMNKKQIQELMNRKFPKPEFKIEYPD